MFVSMMGLYVYSISCSQMLVWCPDYVVTGSSIILCPGNYFRTKNEFSCDNKVVTQHVC